MNAIILCGGLSTRLGEITKNIPKVLLDIKGKTVLEWQLEKIKQLGISEVVLAAGHLSAVLKKEVGDSVNEVKIIYAVEPERLGTGGAIKFAYGFLMRETLRANSDGLMLGAKVVDASSYEILKYDENRRLENFVRRDGLKKPGYINGGLYLLRPQAKKYFPEKAVFSMEYDVFPHMKDLDVYVSDLPWIDIGVPERLEWARNNWQV
jgi:NDP-sugar pyrophosphorylase family protein